MPWMVGRVSNQSVAEVVIKTPDMILADLQAAIVNNYGGASSDYSFFQMTSQQAIRIINGDELTVTWTAGQITGLDFTTTDVKRWLQTTSDKTYIQGNGTEIATLTFTAYKPDKSGIATAFTASVAIGVTSPICSFFVTVPFVNGVATKTFASTQPGRWTFGQMSPKGALRPMNGVVNVEVLGIGVLN